MTQSIPATRHVLLLALVLTTALVAGQAVAADDHDHAEHHNHDAALDGYCPVAYAAMGKAVKGNPELAVEHEGRTYFMANGKAKKMFSKNPDKYAVAYDGWCATGVAHSMKVRSDPEFFVVRDGKTYLFSNAEAKMMFEKDAAATIAKAGENWPAMASMAAMDH
jgi:YHS domain-containing protein